MKIQLSDQVYNNLRAFLAKTTLTGMEVPAYNEVIFYLENPINEEPIMPLPTPGLPTEDQKEKPVPTNTSKTNKK